MSKRDPSSPSLAAKITPSIRDLWKRQPRKRGRLSKRSLFEFLTNVLGYEEWRVSAPSENGNKELQLKARLSSEDIERALQREIDLQGTEPTCDVCRETLKGYDRLGNLCSDCRKSASKGERGWAPPDVWLLKELISQTESDPEAQAQYLSDYAPDAVVQRIRCGLVAHGCLNASQSLTVEHVADNLPNLLCALAPAQAPDIAIAMRLPLDRVAEILEDQPPDKPQGEAAPNPPQPNQQKKPAKANDRMAGTLMEKSVAMEWNSREWAEYLGCAPSTVVATATWGKLESARLQAKAERMNDRRRKS